MAPPRPSPDRCRVVLVLPGELDAARAPEAVESALQGGDVASVIIPPHEMGERAYGDHLKVLVPLIQARGVAALAVRDTRLAARVSADGVHLSGDPEEIEDVMERVGRRMTIGTETPLSRDRALEIGDLEPDYVMMGRIGGDTHDEPHGKALDLAEWWADMIEIPAIAMAGADLDGTLACAETGAEFVGLSRAVFADPGRAREMVSRANTMLDLNAPSFAAGGGVR